MPPRWCWSLRPVRESGRHPGMHLLAADTRRLSGVTPLLAGVPRGQAARRPPKAAGQPSVPCAAEAPADVAGSRCTPPRPFRGSARPRFGREPLSKDHAHCKPILALGAGDQLLRGQPTGRFAEEPVGPRQRRTAGSSPQDGEFVPKYDDCEILEIVRPNAGAKPRTRRSTK